MQLAEKGDESCHLVSHFWVWSMETMLLYLAEFAWCIDVCCHKLLYIMHLFFR